MNHTTNAGRRPLQTLKVLSLWLATILAFLVTANAVTGAWRGLRPVTDGVINQTYLYTMTSGAATHKGIDIPAPLNTDVYAVASGVVVQLREDINNGVAAPAFGNFILVRGDRRHYVTQNNGTSIQSMGYVYYLYAHLALNGVIPTLGSSVSEGQHIGEIDDTGTSTNHHLHLQVILDTNINGDLDNMDEEFWTRNPELWIQPYSDGAVNTSTAIGRVSYANGNTVPNLRICGLTKPSPANYFNSFRNVWTYANVWANRDDLFQENFATTDVQVGSNVHLYARNPSADEVNNPCGGTLFEDLGVYNFVAGQATYIGLYPFYLPKIRLNDGGWTSNIIIRNESSTDTANVTTTIFEPSGLVRMQQNNIIAPRSVAIVVPTGSSLSGAAMVVGSSDLSVTAVHYNGSMVDADNSFKPSTSSGDSVFEKSNTTLYMPAFYNNIFCWNSSLQIMNIGMQSATVSLTFKGRAGYSDYTYTTPTLISVNGQTTLSSATVMGATPWTGSVIASSSQPVSIRVLDTNSCDGGTRTYNASAQGQQTLYIPAAYRENFGITTAIVVQNLGGPSTNVELQFYDRDGTHRTTYTLSSIAGQRSLGVQLTSISALPTDWAGSVRIVNAGAGGPLVSLSAADRTSGEHYAHNAAGTPGGSIFIPRAARDDSGRTTSYLVQNTSTTAGCSVTARYYSTSGVEVTAEQETFNLAARGSAGRWQGNDTNLPSGWTGSIELSSNCGTLVAIGREDTSSSISAYDGLIP